MRLYANSSLSFKFRLITTYYPELLSKVYFVNSPFWFKPLFAVFSLWIPKDTRRKLVFVSKNPEKIVTIGRDNVSSDFGGDGQSMEDDGFLKRAIDFYDEEVKTISYRMK